MAHITIAQAFAQWKQDIKPEVLAMFGADDSVALSESWNDYTDSLCKDGELNDLQYHYCPAWDDVDALADDTDFILEAMGVQLSALRIAERPDNLGEAFQGSSHWKLLIKRGKAEIEVFYSMGSAHKGEPDLADVISCLLSDSSGVEGETFESWADNLGYDSDSRKAEKAFQACQKTALDIKLIFNASELEDIREIFQDY